LRRVAERGSVPVWHVGAIVGLVLVVGVPSLFTRELWSPDEPRYAEVTREMMAGPDRLIPRLNGEVYSEKPPMFFWLAGALWRVGAGPDCARVLSLLAVCGSLLAAYGWFRPAVPEPWALLVPLAALSTLLLWSFTKIGVLDPLLMFFTTAALVLGHGALRRDATRRWLLWLGCYGFMGLGTLTKGPVGIVVPGLVLLSYALLNSRNVRAGGWVHLAGAALFAALVLAWLLPACVKGGGDYARVILLKQNIGRAVHSYSHRKPLYYYLVRWPLYFFPWCFVLPLALAGAWKQWRRGGEGRLLFAALWLVVPFAFFTLVSGKRMNYVLPTTPAVGALVASHFARPSGDRSWRRAERWLMGASFALTAVFLLVCIGLALAHDRLLKSFEEYGVDMQVLLPSLSDGRMAAAAGLFAMPLALCLGVLFARKWGSRRAPWALAAAILLVSLPLDLFVLPTANAFKSAGHFAARLRQQMGPSSVIYFYGGDFHGVYNLYTGISRIEEIQTPQRLKEVLRSPEALVVSEEEDIEKALGPVEGRRRLLYKAWVDHRAMVLLRGGPAAAANDSGRRNAVRAPDGGGRSPG